MIMFHYKIVKCSRATAAAVCALLVVMGISGGAQAAPAIDMINNGNFETGDFSFWTTVNTGSGGTAINNGTFNPAGPGGALPPISGGFDAVTFQGGPGFHAFRQTINVPNNIFSASLTWNDRVRNYAAIFSDPNQEWRVLILDTLAVNAPIEVFSTNPGDPTLQSGPNSRSFDVTAVLQSYAGQMIDVSFEQQDNLSFFNATLDDVVLLVATLPTSKDDCKKGGWATFVNVNTGQQIFKNQGDCVSFVATQGKNPPANY
jgi:hypothetical protein